MTSKLAKAREAFGEPTTATAGATVLAGARPTAEVTIPRTQLKARLRLLSRAEQLQVMADAHRAFDELGLPVGAPGLVAEWNGEVAVRHLAIAVREIDTDQPLAGLEDWRQHCDDDQIAWLFQEYQSLGHRYDPLGQTTISQAELAALQHAAKKKEADLLMSYGSRKLALFAISMAEAPSS